jgi:hypothetical protein
LANRCLSEGRWRLPGDQAVQTARAALRPRHCVRPLNLHP